MNIDVFTINELLFTEAIKYNQTTLANFLNVTRNTIAKYKKDKEGLNHFVRIVNGKYSLYAKTRVEND